jgi:hypothetical protein
MKEQAFQGVVKSIVALENGGKIIKWGEFHEHGD